MRLSGQATDYPARENGEGGYSNKPPIVVFLCWNAMNAARVNDQS